MPRQQVRTIFASDQHLGFRFSQAGPFLEFLKRFQPESLFLVGDFLDGWRLKKSWYWPPVYHDLVTHILELKDQGTRVRYTPGNHDDFLRQPHPAVDGITVQNEFVHETATGARLLVTHGDLFDAVEKKFHRLSRFGSGVYDGLTRFNFFTNRISNRIGLGDLNYCFAAKRWSKRIVGAVGGFEGTLTSYALEQDCDGVICGHIHRPDLRQTDSGVLYGNTGDWVEHQTAIVEMEDGTLQLFDGGKVVQEVVPSRIMAKRPVVMR